MLWVPGWNRFQSCSYVNVSIIVYFHVYILINRIPCYHTQMVNITVFNRKPTEPFQLSGNAFGLRGVFKTEKGKYSLASKLPRKYLYYVFGPGPYI